MDNSPPTLTGESPLSIGVDEEYNFLPIANDSDSSTLSFAIQNKPDWMVFDHQTGRLNGIPRESDVAVYQDIVISVSDEVTHVNFPAFSITVNTPTASNPYHAVRGELYQYLPDYGSLKGKSGVNFQIKNKPFWLNLDHQTGELSGIAEYSPSFGRYLDKRAFHNITVTASLGETHVEITPFPIVVVEDTFKHENKILNVGTHFNGSSTSFHSNCPATNV